MEFEIIDFHTHPFSNLNENLCRFPSSEMDKDFTLSIMKRYGVSKFCGSVLGHTPTTPDNVWEVLSSYNDTALKLYNYYGGSYVAGCHVHPNHVDEIGAHKVVFGTDYPICDLQMYIGAIAHDELLTDNEKRLILSENAKRILKL